MGLPEWAAVEDRGMGQSEQGGGLVTKTKQKLTG